MSGKEVRLGSLAEWKVESRPWAVLICYDYSTVRASSATGIRLLLVSDSAASVIYGYDTTTEIMSEEIIPLARGVVRGTGNVLIAADLPFGTYEAPSEQAVLSTVKMMHETSAYMVEIESGVHIAPRIRVLVNAGIPAVAHIGSTPQSINTLPGFKVQGYGVEAEQLRASAHAVAGAGAVTVILEVMPANLTAEITRELSILTYSTGAGNQCDDQVLV